MFGKTQCTAAQAVDLLHTGSHCNVAASTHGGTPKDVSIFDAESRPICHDPAGIQGRVYRLLWSYCSNRIMDAKQPDDSLYLMSRASLAGPS